MERIILKIFGSIVLIANFSGLTEWLWKKKQYQMTIADNAITTLLAFIMLWI